MAGVATGIGAAAAVGTSAALLVKYGLNSRPLNQTNILSPETAAERMVSKQVLRIKHASNMGLLEAVRHCTFLLSEENLQFVQGKKFKKQENLRRSINVFSTDIETSLAEYSSSRRRDTTSTQTDDAAPNQTANAATTMFRQSKRDSAFSGIRPIDEIDRTIMIEKAKMCLEWAHDPSRAAVPGAENMTDNQVR